MLFNSKWAENTIIFLVMQTVDNALSATLKKGLFRKQLSLKNKKKIRSPPTFPLGRK